MNEFVAEIVRVEGERTSSKTGKSFLVNECFKRVDRGDGHVDSEIKFISVKK